MSEISKVVLTMRNSHSGAAQMSPAVIAIHTSARASFAPFIRCHPALPISIAGIKKDR